MQDPILHVLETVAKWLREGERVCFCTVVATYGSSPRPAGSLFAFSQSGARVGSLSGGCVEDELLAAHDFADEQPFVRAFGVSAEENERLGLPCGGTMSVLQERPELAHIEALIEAIVGHRVHSRRVDLKTGACSLASRTNAAAVPGVTLKNDLFEHVLAPMQRMLLIGAAELSRAVAELALSLQYELHVCDPRPAFINAWDISGVQLHQKMPDDLIRALKLDDSAIVLALTHDPRIDDMGLMEALLRPMFYVGALGSVRSAEKRRQRLAQLGLTAEQIQRLHAPVGLSIGAKTPGEIAVAIMAELIMIKKQNERTGGMNG